VKTIDAYYQWLGIPPKHQPPDYYRLLGLELFEDDRNVIATAAESSVVIEEPGESAAVAVPIEHDGQNHVSEPSVEPPDVEPPDVPSSPVADSEPASPPVQETLEQAEQRLDFEAAGALIDSAREEFVREDLTV
jgi:hypothetical protein